MAGADKALWEICSFPEPLLREVQASAERCIDCKACMRACTLLPGRTHSPKALLQTWASLQGFPEDLPYHCMLCSSCAQACPRSISFKQIAMGMREAVVDRYQGRLPKRFRVGGVHWHQQRRLSPAVQAESVLPGGDTLFFPGCGLLTHSMDLVTRIYEALRREIPGLGISMACCGKPTKFLGERAAFESYVEGFYARLKALGVRRILTACENCLMAFRDLNWPDIRVDSLYVYMAEAHWEQHLDPGPVPAELIVHDPCPTRGLPELHDAVRALLAPLNREIREFRLNRERTSCCGSGGMLGSCNPALSRSFNAKRVEEAGSAVIVSYCRECVCGMRRQGHPAYHILDLYFGEGFRGDPLDQTGWLKGLWQQERGRRMVKQIKRGADV